MIICKEQIINAMSRVAKCYVRRMQMISGRQKK